MSKVTVAKTKKAKKPTKGASQPAATAKPRLLEPANIVWYNPLTWRRQRYYPDRAPLPKARHIMKTSLNQLWTHKWLFGGIILIYTLLNLLLVQSVQNSDDLAAFRKEFEGFSGGFGTKLFSATTSFAFLLTNSSSSTTAVSGIYQTILFVICSLATIWALRQIIAGHTIKIRDSFYSGMYPLIPFLLMFLLLSVQLLPFLISATFYSYATTNQIIFGGWQKVLFVLPVLALGIWSLRMITATLFGFYVVTLPSMTPVRAYRNARELVAGRRLLLWRKLIFLPIAFLLVAAVIVIPFIFFAPVIAVWLFFLFSMAGLPLAHAYLYNLYRKML